MNFSEHGRESVASVVVLGVGPNHANDIDYTWQEFADFRWLGVGQLVARVFEDHQKLQIVLRLS